jgi:hypothetical protein
VAPNHLPYRRRNCHPRRRLRHWHQCRQHTRTLARCRIFRRPQAVTSHVEPPADNLLAGTKVYFKQPSTGKVYEFDAAEVEKARKAGLEPATTEDIAQALSRPHETEACAMANGVYSIRYTERDGTCGYVKEVLADWHGVGGSWRVPAGCKGTVAPTADHRQVSWDYHCPSWKGGPNDDSHVVLVRWSKDASSGVGVEQRIFHYKDGTWCSSTYNVTYTRM